MSFVYVDYNLVDLFRCTNCGAVVTAGDRTKHENFDKLLNVLLTSKVKA